MTVTSARLCDKGREARPFCSHGTSFAGSNFGYKAPQLRLRFSLGIDVHSSREGPSIGRRVREVPQGITQASGRRHRSLGYRRFRLTCPWQCGGSPVADTPNLFPRRLRLLALLSSHTWSSRWFLEGSPMTGVVVAVLSGDVGAGGVVSAVVAGTVSPGGVVSAVVAGNVCPGVEVVVVVRGYREQRQDITRSSR